MCLDCNLSWLCCWLGIAGCNAALEELCLCFDWQKAATLTVWKEKKLQRGVLFPGFNERTQRNWFNLLTWHLPLLFLLTCILFHTVFMYSVWRLSEVKATVFHLIVDIPEFVCCALRILLIPQKILHDHYPKVQKLRQKQIWDQKSVAFSMNPALSHTHVYKLTVRLAEWLNICNNPIKGNCIPVKVTEKEM